jgi:hypothetical protein
MRDMLGAAIVTTHPCRVAMALGVTVTELGIQTGDPGTVFACAEA